MPNSINNWLTKYRNQKRKSIKKIAKPTKGDLFLNAVARGDVNEVQKYLDEDEDVTVYNCKGETALHIAAAHHQNAILGILLPYFEYKLDIRNMFDDPAYITAVKYGNKEGAEIILDYFKNKSNEYIQNSSTNNIITLQNPIVTPEGIITTANKLSLNNFINTIKEYDNNIPKNIVKNKNNKTQKRSKVGVKKELKKTIKNKVPSVLPLNKSIKNMVKTYINEYIKEYTKTKPVKAVQAKKERITKRNISKYINNIKGIGNLPEELQYIPRGTFVNINRGPGYNNTRVKHVRIANKKEEQAELKRIRKQIEKEEKEREKERQKEEKKLAK
jgi:hypothetical protein